jgi:hypothetical protein
MTGRAYLERGALVVVAPRWGPGGGPRNVLVRRADGELVVQPSRGLRRTGQPGVRKAAGPRVAGPLVDAEFGLELVEVDGQVFAFVHG